eukprot:6212541-Pleurochrysis_carterae.AAC.5
MVLEVARHGLGAQHPFSQKRHADANCPIQDCSHFMCVGYTICKDKEAYIAGWRASNYMVGKTCSNMCSIYAWSVEYYHKRRDGAALSARMRGRKHRRPVTPARGKGLRESNQRG